MSLCGVTVAEVINGLCSQIKGLRPDPKTGKHILRVHGYDTKESLFIPLAEDVTELHITPDFSCGKGGFWKIALGTVLIAASFIPGLNVAVMGSAGGILASTTWASLAFNMGLSLALGGLLELISPAPQMDLSTGSADPAPSKYFGSDGNTVKIGTRIPIIYGEHIAYGHILTFNVSSSHVATS